jgi:hypothetical protein
MFITSKLSIEFLINIKHLLLIQFSLVTNRFSFDLQKLLVNLLGINLLKSLLTIAIILYNTLLINILRIRENPE